jgi:ribosomal protein L11 methyltransferase
VPEVGLSAYEAALSSICDSVGFFGDQEINVWRIEGVRPTGCNDPALSAALALAARISGIQVEAQRAPIAAEGWLARSYASFPEQLIGRRFSVRGTHLRSDAAPGRLALTLDAGLAFGSGEHGSTRGCIRALERVAWRRPKHILDLGTGSGILAIAAARLLHRRVLAIDIEPWSVLVARRNVARNQLTRFVQVRRADGWRASAVRRHGPYDLVLANVLAQPLSLMARQLASNMAPRGTAILSGLLAYQARAVLAAHLRCGLRLEAGLQEGPWVTLILRRTSDRRTLEAIHLMAVERVWGGGPLQVQRRG